MQLGLKIITFVLILDLMVIGSAHVLTSMDGEGSSFAAQFNSTPLSSYAGMTDEGADVNETQTRFAENLGKESTFSKLTGGVGDLIGTVGQFAAWLGTFISMFAMPITIWNHVFNDVSGVMLFVKQMIQGIFTILNFLLFAALIQFIRGGNL